MSELITITTPLRSFKGHEGRITAVAVFPNKRRMVTGSEDKTLRLWDLKTGVVLKKMEGHRNGVMRLAVSRDGQLIASGDTSGEVIIWHGETGESLTKIKAHSYLTSSLDFSPDGTVLATASYSDKMTKLWNTKTWELQGDPIECGYYIRCIRYSPSGELLAIATEYNIQIYNSGTSKPVTSFKAHKSFLSLTWTPDGTRLLTGGDREDPTIREWDTKTWEQVGDPWTGHTDYINSIAIHPAGTLVASASSDHHVRLWQLSNRQTIAVFKHSLANLCVTFSVDGNHIFSGGNDGMISEWTVPQGIHPKTIATTTVRDACIDGDLSTDEELLMQDIHTDADNHTPYVHRSKILAITTSRIACVNGDLSTAEGLLTQDINTNPNDHTSYAHRSFVMARKCDWDRALLDAIKSIRIQPSLTGYISKGIALCGKGRVLDARAAFDVASMYTDQDSKITHFLLLIKAIALFNADQHDEANLLLKELATGCPNADTLACDIVQAYLHVQLGIKALDGVRYDEAADHFTAALDSRDLSSKSNVPEIYEDLVVLFGWDLKSLWKKARQKRCDALLRAGKLQDAVKSYQHMMTSSDVITKADCLDWSNDFKQQCSALCAANGEAAFAASDYDKAIDLFSMAIDLDYASDVVFANRSQAKLSKSLWEDALLNALKAQGRTEVNAITEDPTDSFGASASTDCHPLPRLLHRNPTAEPFGMYSDTYSTYGKHIHGEGKDRKLSDRHWPILVDSVVDSKILAMNTATRNACITGDLHAAEALLTQQIDADCNDHNAYANRSFVRARKADWDHAFDDALKSISILHSLSGYISKGIALCGKMQIQDAMDAFDLASIFTNEYSKTTHILLLLIKAITYFNANQHEHAIMHIQRLADVCPKADIPVCHIVEAYLRLQLGINAFDGAYENEADEHLTVIINTIASTSQSAIHSTYEDFVVLFGWNLKQLWQIASQRRCDALLRAGMPREAHESYRYMMDMSDKATKASCLDWSTVFKQKCSALYAVDGDAAALTASGDTALDANNYDKAIELYSAAIDLDSATEAIFANRSKARLEEMLWEDALLDAQKVIELSPSSYLGYQLKHEAMHGARRYDEAIEAFQVMLSKLDNSSDTQLQELRQQYISPSEAKDAIMRAIYVELECVPIRLLDISAGRLCDRKAQSNAFKTSAEYKQLLSSTINRADLWEERIKEVVAMYFRYVMLSHRWEEHETLLHDIQDKDVYELTPVGGTVKLQSFCKTAHTAGYRWGWIDTCCIDKRSNTEIQESVNSMFVWYCHSALTIVYLSDVPPSSKKGALAMSAWNQRGWTLPEFLASKVVQFYQSDWTPYLDDRSSNHKESPAIMRELEDKMGIDARALITFHRGMSNAREKLQWASARVTTIEEDIAYSLFGIFDVHLPVIYGERKQMALGRLLQEIVAKSGDISALDWVGQSSEFNSCLPADITSYKAPPHTMPSLSEDEIQTSISSLRHMAAEHFALKIYDQLDNMSSPRFANCRLLLPCIAFRVTEVKRRRGVCEETISYEVKADGLCDLTITTEDRSIRFSRVIPALFLVRPWDRFLLGLPDFSDDRQSVDDSSDSESQSSRSSPGEQRSVRSESHPHALRLLAHLKQPFAAFLLARQRGGEYKRIASDREIIAQVQDVTFAHSMDVRTLEIL